MSVPARAGVEGSGARARDFPTMNAVCSVPDCPHLAPCPTHDRTWVDTTGGHGVGYAPESWPATTTVARAARWPSTVHHVLPLSAGGDDDPANLRPCAVPATTTRIGDRRGWDRDPLPAESTRQDLLPRNVYGSPGKCGHEPAEIGVPWRSFPGLSSVNWSAGPRRRQARRGEREPARSRFVTCARYAAAAHPRRECPRHAEAVGSSTHGPGRTGTA